MAIDTLQRLLLFAILTLAQILVLNRIELFHCAMPLLYVYFAITFPRNYPKWAALLWSFALGLTMDTFTNTPGVAAASLTLIGVLQPYLLEVFLPRDAEPDMKVSTVTLGYWKFVLFALLLTLLFCTVFFSLQAFRLYDWQHLLLCIGSSTLLTLILMMALEGVKR